jgi:CRP-like cAMP-binding protein
MFANEIFAQLKAFYYFLVPQLPEESWDICESVLTVRRIKKGQLLLKEGQVCNYVSFINKGSIRVFYNVDGKEKVLCFFNENNYVSDYTSFLTRKPALLCIQALEDTELIETSYEGLQMLYSRVPEANLLGRIIAEQLFIRMSEISGLGRQDTIEERYAQLISEQPWLMQKVPQYMIASYLGITPEALSRAKSRRNKPLKKAKAVIAA